jgi:hypothetical protein
MKRSLIAQMQASKTAARVPIRFNKAEFNIRPALQSRLATVSDIVAYPARTDPSPPTQCDGEYVEIGDIQSGEYHESVQDSAGQIALNCWDENMLSYTKLTVEGTGNTEDQYDVYCYENGIWLQQTGTFAEGDSYTCAGASEERYRTYEHIVGSNGGNSPSTCNTTAPADGNNCVNTTLFDGETCTQTCDPDYTSDDYEATCSNGTFTPITCTEVSDPCDPNPCKNGGTCTVDGNSHTCACPAGYEGVNCTTVSDPCDPNPCQNGGTCTADGNSHTCACAAGYNGANCNNDCGSSSSCANGDACSSGSHCASESCDYVSGVCQAAGTANGGTCSANGDCASNDCDNGVCVCIEVGQRVLMDDGTHKNIEHLLPGDVLRTPTGRTTVRSTRRGGRHLSAVHDVSCNGMTGSITGNHAYHCDGEWRLPQETHKPRALTGTTEVVAVETDNYCEDRMILESGLHVETWDGRGIDEWRPHSYENGRRLRCTLKGSWRDRVLQRVDSKN